MARRNPFTKEYYTGRKDQYDIDYSIFRKAVEETQTREELIKYMEEQLSYVISRIADENARELMEEMNLVLVHQFDHFRQFLTNFFTFICEINHVPVRI